FAATQFAHRAPLICTPKVAATAKLRLFRAVYFAYGVKLAGGTILVTSVPHGIRRAVGPFKGSGTREEGRSDHQAVQARRGEGSPSRDRRVRHHRYRGQGLRPAEGSHRTLPRRGIRRRFPAQGE